MPRNIVSLYRARLAKEKGYIKKDPGGRVSIALVYPNSYHLGMSNLGFQLIYHLFNQRNDVVAERAFLPVGHEMSLYQQSGKPLVSLESQRPIKDFDLLAFSLCFENDYPNILSILELAQIPILSMDRTNAHPLVMGGGIATFLNPEPISSFFDFFLLGEAEPILHTFVETFLELAKKEGSKMGVLEKLALGLDSIYVPRFYKTKYKEDGTINFFASSYSDIPKTIKVSKSDAASWGIAYSTIQSPETEFSNMKLVELGRGCGRGCRFCAAGFVYRPPRFQDLEKIMGFIRIHAKQKLRLGLISPAVSDVPSVHKITYEILERGSTFSVSSLRADSITPALLKQLKAAGHKTITIAPEAGSDRLRRVINKQLTREDILRAVQLISEAGEFNLRLYFMIGLPTETHDDIEEIFDLVKVIRHYMVKEGAPRGRVGNITLSINCFVPKPFTPFQWFPMEQEDSLKEKQKWLKKMIKKEGGIQINFDVTKWAYVQTLLSLGDRRVCNMLIRAHEFENNWKKALKFSDVNPDFFVYRPKALDEILPWDFIDHGLSKAFLKAEYHNALKEKKTPACRVGSCFKCGVCTPEGISQ